MNNLKKHRKIAGLSQSQLADKIPGLNLRTLQFYEQGRLNIRRAAAETVVALAEVLGCKITDLFD